MPRFDFQFDRISFWIGFVAATLFWWVFSQVRPLLPALRSRIKKQIEAFRERNLAGAEAVLRRETYRRAQRSHLSAAMFALDEILIEPRLIAPSIPHALDPSNQDHPTAYTTASQVLPYLPDWPELVSATGAPTLSLAEAIQRGSHILITGQPGSGKSTALAHLASQLALDSTPKENAPVLLPMLVHILDLDTSLENGRSPLNNLMKSITAQVGVVFQPQVTKFLNTVFNSQHWKPVLLLDGLDELPAGEVDQVANYLKALLKKYPHLQVIAAASELYTGALTRLGFYPLGLATWNLTQRRKFVQRWSDLWTAHIMPEAQKRLPGTQTDPLLINTWLDKEIEFDNPLELTLRVWSAYAGDLNGSSASHLVETFILRGLISPAFYPALKDLAHRYLLNGKGSMIFDEMDKLLSSFQASSTTDNLEGELLPEYTEPAPRKKRSRLRQETEIVSQGEKLINKLLSSGLLVEHNGGQMRFSSPVFAGFLAATQLSPEEADAVAQAPDWEPAVQALRFSAACGDPSPWMARLIQNPQPPLFKSLLLAARWLSDAPASASWRSAVLRQFVSLIQRENVPLGTRARIMAAFIISRDPSTPKLLKQLLISRSPIVRQIALLGCGALGVTTLFDDILALLADPTPTVRAAACLAISALPGELALNTLVEILLSGDESIRQTAAEVLAHRSPEGHQALKEAIESNDLLTRRACVFGLMQIKEEWARQLLEKTAVEDGQWVVRNAAAQALENFQQSNPHIPQPYPPPSESPWLLAFAGKLGLGIQPGSPATEVLLAALKSGTPDEQVAALTYLRNQPDDGVIGALYNALYSGQPNLQEPALDALAWMSMSGVQLPSPMQFGLG